MRRRTGREPLGSAPRYLGNHKHPKEARTQGQQFLAMHCRFIEVHSDMVKIKKMDQLKHTNKLKLFMKRLPDTCASRYIEYMIRMK